MTSYNASVRSELTLLPRHRLLELAEAGRSFMLCRQELAAAGISVVIDVAGSEILQPFNHYPRGDVYDFDSHAQYYFHQHRAREVGHFHTFLRPRGMPPGVHPADPSDWRDPSDNDALSHLVAIAIDERGEPERLFTTNRWVTAETWYRAEDVKAMLPCFQISRDSPCGLTNRWVTSLVALFRPQIERLLVERDACLAAHSHRVAGIPAMEDRDLEVLSQQPINVDAQLDELRGVLAGIG